MFQIIGAMAEFERSLIQERVKARLRNARAKGKKFGRPRAYVDAEPGVRTGPRGAFVVSSMPNPQCEQGERAQRIALAACRKGSGTYPAGLGKRADNSFGGIPGERPPP